MFLRARRWSVGACAFYIQPAKRTLRMSTFVVPVAEIVLLLCDKMVWLALLTEHRASGAWTSPLLPPRVPSVIALVRIGQSRIYCLTSACQLKQLFQQPTSSKSTSNWFSEAHMNSYEGASPIQHNVDNTGCLGIVSSMLLLVFLLASVKNQEVWKDQITI